MSAPASVKATASTPTPHISIRLPPRRPRKLSGVAFMTSSAVLHNGNGLRGGSSQNQVRRSGIAVESRHASQNQHQQQRTPARKQESAGARRNPDTGGGPDRGGCGEATDPVAFLGDENDSRAQETNPHCHRLDDADGVTPSASHGSSGLVLKRQLPQRGKQGGFYAHHHVISQAGRLMGRLSLPAQNARQNCRYEQPK